MTIANYITIEQEAQIREYVIEYVTNEFNTNECINAQECLRDIISEFKRNYISYRIGIITCTISKLIDKLIYNI